MNYRRTVWDQSVDAKDQLPQRYHCLAGMSTGLSRSTGSKCHKQASSSCQPARSARKVNVSTRTQSWPSSFRPDFRCGNALKTQNV